MSLAYSEYIIRMRLRACHLICIGIMNSRGPIRELTLGALHEIGLAVDFYSSISSHWLLFDRYERNHSCILWCRVLLKSSSTVVAAVYFLIKSELQNLMNSNTESFVDLFFRKPILFTRKRLNLSQKLLIWAWISFSITLLRNWRVELGL